MATLDKATLCCAHITTVAELLEGCGEAKWLEGKTVARTGTLLLSEAEKLTELLKDCASSCED